MIPALATSYNRGSVASTLFLQLVSMERHLRVGQRLKELRRQLELRAGQRRTQTWLASQVGVTKSSVAKWETDVQVPGRDYIFRLADVLETTPEYILTGVSEPGIMRETARGYGETPSRSEEESPEDAVRESEVDAWAHSILGVARMMGGGEDLTDDERRLRTKDLLTGAIKLGEEEGRNVRLLYEALGRLAVQGRI